MQKKLNLINIISSANFVTAMYLKILWFSVISRIWFGMNYMGIYISIKITGSFLRHWKVEFASFFHKL